MHLVFLGAALLYLLIVLAIVSAAVYGVGFLFRKGWDRGGRPPQ